MNSAICRNIVSTSWRIKHLRRQHLAKLVVIEIIVIIHRNSLEQEFSALNTISDGDPADHWLFSSSGVVLDVAYVTADLEGFHFVGGERAQQVDRRLGGVIPRR